MLQRQKEAESKAVGSLIKAIFAACMPDPAVLWVKNSYRNGRNTHTLIFENLTPEISKNQFSII